VSGSFSLGTQWEPLANKLFIGLSYQAPPGLYGGQTIHGELDNWLLSGRPLTAKVEMVQTLPDIVRWALRYHVEGKYELRLFGDYTRWSTMQRQCLVTENTKCVLGENGLPEGANVVSNHERRWKDTFTIRAGASYWFIPQLETFVGMGYDSNAIKSGFLEPGLIDGKDISFSLGGRLVLGEHMGLLLSYTHIQMIDRTVKNSQLGELEGISRLPTADGDYKQWFGMLNGLAEFYFN
jgi:long-chain fatty acid transport protein